MKENNNISNSNSAPILNLSEKERRKLIVDNYLPNLSQYQIITKKVKDEQFNLSPNVNFTDQKDYFIFYNDNLLTLTDLYRKELKRYLENHNVILYYKKENLEESIYSGNLNLNADEGISLLKFISKIISSKYKENIDYANNLAINISQLVKIQKEFSNKITPEKICAVTVSEKLFDETIKVKAFLKDKKPPKNDYLKYIKEIEDIKNSKIDDNIEKVKLLDKKIDIFRKEINPENSIDDMNDFCFVLNKISDYLRNLERSFENKELKLLEEMDYLRRKLDYYLLEFRFKFVENQAPILNVKIRRYKILCNSEEITSIFLEKGEIHNFIKMLVEELDNKGKNIDSKYQFKNIELKELIVIAQNIKFDKYEDLINNYDTKINNLKDQLKSKKLEFTTDISKKLSSKIIDLTLNKNLAQINIKTNGEYNPLSENEIKKFLESDKSLIEKQKKVKKIMKNDESSEEKISEKNTNNTNNNEEKTQKKEDEKVEEKKEDEKIEEKKEDENVEEKNNENKINENIKEKPNESDEILESRKKNLNLLGIDPKNFTNEVIDNISSAFQMYFDMKKIKSSIEQNENIKNKILSNLKYYLDFFNALKLYTYIRKIQEKDDIYGIILEEKRKFVTQESNGKKFSKEIENLREYKINEINNNF